MGAEATCTARVGRVVVKGKARLETATLHFHGGDLALTIPFAVMTTAAARKGRLHVTWPAGRAAFDLGDAAAKWAAKIANPPSRIAKLGVKAGHRVSIVALDDPELVAELTAVGATIVAGRAAAASDVVFLRIATERELDRIAAVSRALAPAGALWVIRPKGRDGVAERAVMAAGKAAGLVDVKVASYSATHTAEKFVIPVAKRGPTRA